MGQFLDTCKYKRDCKKCRLIDIETDDIFDDEPLSYLETKATENASRTYDKQSHK